MDNKIKETFLAIIKEELMPAMGCTEPIALAYASAKAREYLGATPTKIIAECSDNIIKNVRCVQIPNSHGMHGIEAAVLLGAVGGDAARQMEVLEAVSCEHIETVNAMLTNELCSVEPLASDIPLHFIINMYAQDDFVRLEVRYSHLNIVKAEKNGKVIFEKDGGAPAAVSADRSMLSIEKIKEFADEIDICEIEQIYDRQIRCNMDIANEGMSGKYGLGIGKIICSSYDDSTVTRMRAYAAAASEARMDGCDMPVIINSGSGNQGIASSVPVIIYAKDNAIPKDKLYRALAFSSLLTVYQKEFIGKLSAFCGAVSASCAAGAAITYICGGDMKQIKATIGNTLANVPGIICDGAKISCAAKIASSIDASMLAHFLAMNGKEYEAYTGILKDEIGETIRCVGHIGKVGMKETDKEIVRLMLEN